MKYEKAVKYGADLLLAPPVFLKIFDEIRWMVQYTQ
jgi:hypothetical protein